MARNKWDSMYMKMAFCAAHMSHATKRQVGAIAVKEDNVIGIGINGTPVGWPDNNCEDLNNKTYPYVLHAETNMISKVAKSSISSVGATCYTTTAPCFDCAKAIYQAGFSKVVYYDPYKNTDGVDFLKKMKVEVIELYDEKIPDLKDQNTQENLK